MLDIQTRWYHLVAYFFGGAFLANMIPHLVNGISGSPFQSPFASPPGEGLSSSIVNVLWGMFNLVVASLVARVGRFDLRQTKHVVVLGLGDIGHGTHAGTGIWKVSWGHPLTKPQVLLTDRYELAEGSGQTVMFIQDNNMQTIVDDWKANAERHDNRNFAFLRSLKMKDDRAVDRVAHRLHEEAFSSSTAPNVPTAARQSRRCSENGHWPHRRTHGHEAD